MSLVDGLTYTGDRRGRTAELIPWSENHVLKLFRQGFPREIVECEFLNARAAGDLGLPTPRAERVVKVDTRFGIVFERCRGVSLYDALVSGTDSPDRLAGIFFELQQLIHSRPCSNFPIQAGRLREKIRRVIDVADTARARALRFLDEASGAPHLCHGDFHPLNVLLTPLGACALDWLDACQGDPAAELSFSGHPLELGLLERPVFDAERFGSRQRQDNVEKLFLR